MVKLVYCLRRKDGISREEFQQDWFENHGPLVRSRAQALRLRRYVQGHTLAGSMNDALRASRGAPEAFDGVAELWFDSVEAMAAATSSDEGRAAALELRENEEKIVDFARSPLWVVEEREIVLVG